LPAKSRAYLVLKFMTWALCISQGLVHIVATPLWDGWDEAFHYSYIQILVEDQRLPVVGQSIVSREITRSFELAPLSYAGNLNVGNKYTTFEQYWQLSVEERKHREQQLREIGSAERRLLPEEGARFQSYEAQQAPLFYVLAAPVYQLFSSSDLPTRAFTLRVFSLLLASLTIPLTFATVRYTSLGRQLTFIPVLLTLLPGLYPVIARISNDGLAITLFSALFFLVVRYFARGSNVRDAVGIGVVLGLGLLTKGYFLAAIPALGLLFLLAFFMSRSRSQLAIHALIIGVLATFQAGAWYLRNLELYGNISGWLIANDPGPTFVDKVSAIAKIDWISGIQSMVKQHIWTGNTSYIFLSGTTYNVGYFLIALAVLGAIKSALQWIRLPAAMKLADSRAHSLLALAVFYAFLWAAMLYHMLITFVVIAVSGGTGGWYLYAGVVPEVILLVHGMEAIAGKRFALLSDRILLSYVLVANLVSLLCMMLPNYGGLRISKFHLSHFIDIYFGSGLRVMLQNLALNKPAFVTPGAIAASIVFFLVLLVTTLGYARRIDRIANE